ncbi:MAG TPA: methylated-DNA--[protein]-cysteine S-methyltransferase [Actinotalea sp.]|nr:methylated-DNA--[protein]-cysteine S-methyltransferase [Actinotalea sp.]
MTAALLTTVVTPDGPFTVLADADGAVLASGWTDDVARVVERVRAEDRPASLDVVAPDHPGLATAVDAVTAYYAGDLHAVDAVPVRQHGTPWRLRGWARLRQIPPGAPLSYAGLARALDAPTAVRAAASICASNAPALFVPCHRVLRSDGSLGGFAWGLDVKRSLLTREAPAG